MTATKKNKTNRTRAARRLARLEPSLSHAQALHLLRDLVPVGAPVPDLTDAVVRGALLTRWRTRHPHVRSASYAYLACYDGYSLKLAATHGALHAHDLGSTEDDRTALETLPATPGDGELWFWFENQTYAADCYRAGDGVEVLSYDWSLLAADMRSSHADASYLHDRAEDAYGDITRLTDLAPQVSAALLTDAVRTVAGLVDDGGTDEVRATAARWLTALTGLAGEAAATSTAATAGDAPDDDLPCEVDDCDDPATVCECGAAHCPAHPHVPDGTAGSC